MSIVLLGSVLSAGFGFGLSPAAAVALEEWPIERWAGDERAPAPGVSPSPTLARITPSRPWKLCTVYPHLK
ncbi:MAG: TMAO reductase system periplasmic protein TorT, partial [Thauera sp.]|nr:TMAO reductase system periplasmic protein TorT [Thauera sp.]